MSQKTRDLKWIFLSALMIMLSVAIICGTSVLEKAIDRGLFDRPVVDTPNGDNPATVETLKTGMAVVTSASPKNATAEKDGTAQVDATLVGVTVDKDGKIVDVMIDTVQTKVAINAKGEITSELGSAFKTKNELGFDYGMVAYNASPIGKEWFEQIDAFEEYIIGKTADEVKAIAVDEGGYPTGDDLRAGCTMGIDGYIEGVVKAMENATEMGAEKGDELNIAIIATVSKDSKSATAEAAGNAQADVNFAVVTVKDGKTTSVLVDSLQAKTPVNADGTLGEASTKTKKELGFDYGMVAYNASPIGKEWFEQAEAFEKFASGNYDKIDMDASGYTQNDDLKAGCTINLYPFTNIVNKAIGK